MLKLVRKMGQIPFSDLMAVYAESNGKLAREQWPEEPEGMRLYRAEMDFYQYLRHDFFTVSLVRHADDLYIHALWMVEGKPVSAVRFEKWKDGVLLEALETRPDQRRKGYGFLLMRAALNEVTGKVYSHVARDNEASLGLHEKCGFRRCGDTALVDGSFDRRFVTLVRE